MKRGDCPNCGATHRWPSLGVDLIEFEGGIKELWCSSCRHALAPEETSLQVQCAFAQNAADKRKAKAAMAKMERRIRRFIESRAT